MLLDFAFLPDLHVSEHPLIGAAVSPAQAGFTVTTIFLQQNHSSAHLLRLVSLAQQIKLFLQKLHTYVTIPDKQSSRPSYPIRDPINGYSLCNYSRDSYSSVLATGSSQAPQASPSSAKLLETCLSQPLRSPSVLFSFHIRVRPWLLVDCWTKLPHLGQYHLRSHSSASAPPGRIKHFSLHARSHRRTLCSTRLARCPYLICMSQHNHIT